jgi:PAS domain S-box-containing protein
MRRRHLWLIGVGALALGTASVVAGLTSRHQSHAWGVVAPLAGWAFVAAGLVGWSQRPDNRSGRLLVAVGGTFLVLSTFWAANDSLLWTIGNAFGAVYLAVFVQLILSYPAGRLTGRLETWLVASLYAIATIASVVPTLFDRELGCTSPNCPTNVFLVSDDEALDSAFTTAGSVVGIVVFVGLLAVLGRRWRRASAARRRVLRPVYISGGTAIAAIGVGFAAGLASDVLASVFWAIALTAYIALPFFFLWGLLRTRFGRRGIRLLLESPDEPTPSEAEASLRRALDDPTLRLAYWLDERRGYVDTTGAALDPEAPLDGRLATRIEYEGRPLAAIEYDASLSHEPELLEEVLATARLALEKDRDVQALRSVEARQRALLDAMPDLMIRTARDGTYLDIQGDASGLARPREELLGRTIWEVLPAERAARLMDAVHRVLDTGIPQTIEYQLELDGERRDFEARMVGSGDDEVLAVVREFTERRRLQDELRARLAEIEREQEFNRTVVDVAPIVFLLVEPDGKIVRFNDTCQSISGVRDDERARGNPFWEVFVVPDDHERARHVLAQLAAGAPRVEQELRWRGRGGSELLVSTSSSAILDGQGRFRFLICGLDVTERQRHVAEIRASRARLVEASDSERRRLERNLHDGAQQRLVSLSLALRLALAKLQTDPQAAEPLIRGAADELTLALEELRELARGIHPAILTDRGLAAALEAVAQRAPLPVDLEALPAERLPGPVEAAAFYVVSESLTNVAKYAQASTARVRVDASNGHAVVEVTDDGVGGADPVRGSGLRGLADRVEALDGRLEVESVPGRGTQVRAVIPLDGARR